MEKNSEDRKEVDFFAESRLLRALYANPDYLDDSEITEDLFSSQSTKNVYKSLANMKANGTKFSRDSLYQEYAILDLNANDYIVDRVASVTDEDSNVDLKDILAQVRDFRKRREAVAALKKAQKIIENSSRITEDEYNEIEGLVSSSQISLSKVNEKDIKKVMTFKDWFDDYMPNLKARENGKQYFFRNFIFDNLVDDGPEPGTIGTIASASGSGKSTVCSNLVNSFIECKIPVMWYSLEMSEVAMMDRLLAKRLGIKYKDIKNPPEDDFEDIVSQVEDERKELEENKLFRFSENPNVSISSLRKDIKKFKAEANTNYCIVVLDLLSMVSDFTKFGNGVNSAQGIEFAMNDLSGLAKEMNVHIIGTLQLTREVEKTSVSNWDDLDKLRPSRATIKNAGAFLERSRYVITSFRKKMYAELFLEEDEYKDKIDEIEVSIVKQNNGEIGKTVSAFFDSDHFDIIPMAESSTEDKDKEFKED